MYADNENDFTDDIFACTQSFNADTKFDDANVHPSLLRTFGFSAISKYLRFVPHINLWKQCIDLMLFSKYLGGLFLRSKEVTW